MFFTFRCLDIKEKMLTCMKKYVPSKTSEVLTSCLFFSTTFRPVLYTFPFIPPAIFIDFLHLFHTAGTQVLLSLIYSLLPWILEVTLLYTSQMYNAAPSYLFLMMILLFGKTVFCEQTDCR